MSNKRGKHFESEIAALLRGHPAVAYVHHAPDLMGNKFTRPNPIDFLCYWQGGHGLAVECKAFKGKSLPYSRLPDRQWRALEQCAQAGVDVFVFANNYGWPGRDGARGRAWAVPWFVLAEARTERRKSWPLAVFADCCELRKVGTGWEWEP